MGLALPLVGLGIAAVLWWVGEGGLQRAGPTAPQPGPLEVRSRSTGVPSPVPAGDPGSGVRTGAPAPPATTAEVTVQVGSYRTRSKAERVLAEVRERTGLPGLILDSQVDGVAWHRILLGAFATPREALEAVRILTPDHEVLVRPLPDRWAPVLSGGTGVNPEGGTP